MLEPRMCEIYSEVVKLIKKDSLKVQLETVRTYFERQELNNIKFNDIVDYLHMLEAPMWEIYSEDVTLVYLLLVIPATNATSERTFSALRRIKTYLWSTRTQAILYHLLTLHTHKDKTDRCTWLNRDHKLLSCQSRVTVSSCFVYKIIGDL